MDNKKNMGNVLLELRTKHGFTQDEIAEKIGISKMSYFRYENNQREVGSTIVAKLAEIYNVSTDYIIGVEKEKDKETRDLMNLRDTLRRSPATRTLFSLTKNATEKDIQKVVRMLEVLKDDESGGN